MRSPKCEVRSPKCEVRSAKSEVRLPSSDFALRTSHFGLPSDFALRTYLVYTGSKLNLLATNSFTRA